MTKKDLKLMLGKEKSYKLEVVLQKTSKRVQGENWP